MKKQYTIVTQACFARRSLLAGTLGLAGAAFVGCQARAADIVDLRKNLGGDGDLTDLILRLKRAGIRDAWLAPGNYTVQAGTDIGALRLRGAGSDTVIRPLGVTGNEALFVAQGSMTLLPLLARSGRIEGWSLKLAAREVLRRGDLLQVFDPRVSSLSANRPEYRAGEFAYVAAVEAEKVHLRKPLRGSYEVSAVKLALIRPAKLSISRLRLETGSAPGLRCSLAENPMVEALTVECAASHGLYFDRCSGLSVIDSSATNQGAGSNSDYGLAIGNSQGGSVTGGHFYGRRHGISLGGGDFVNGTPTSDLLIDGCTISNDTNRGITAADMHGNCQRIEYRNCRIEGGATLGGFDGAYRSCSIDDMRNGICVYGAEIGGGHFTLDRCLLRSHADASQTYRGIVDMGGNSTAIGRNTIADVSLELTNCRVEASRQSATSRVVELRNRGSRFDIDLTVTDLQLAMNAGIAVVSLRDQESPGWRGKVEIGNVIGRPSKMRDLVSTGA